MARRADADSVAAPAAPAPIVSDAAAAPSLPPSDGRIGRSAKSIDEESIRQAHGVTAAASEADADADDAAEADKQAGDPIPMEASGRVQSAGLPARRGHPGHCRNIPAPDRADFCPTARSSRRASGAGVDDELRGRMEDARISRALAWRTRRPRRISSGRNLGSAPKPSALRSRTCRGARQRVRGSPCHLRFRGSTTTGFAASAGLVAAAADALPKLSRSLASRCASATMVWMLSRLASPPFTASPI